MHDQPPQQPTNPVERPDSVVSHEGPPRPRPSIYVASLADYNNGRLHGEWINAAREPEAIQADIAAMLARSTQPDAEEFAIHDYEQFGSCRIHEYDSIELVSRIARGIAEHGYAFAAWAEVTESDPDRFDDFTDAYLGHYDAVQDYAEQLADDLGYTAQLARLPEAMRPYVRIDTAAMARDMQLSSEMCVFPDPAGGVWLFDGEA